MNEDIFDELSSANLLGKLMDSLREELDKAICVSSVSTKVVSSYIRLKRKDLTELILEFDVNGTIMWKENLKKYALKSSHIAAGVYKVWLESYIGEREYAKSIGKAKCNYGLPYYGECAAIAEIGQEYCVEHLKEKCSCGKQATHGCSFAGQFVCGRPLCKNCKCNH